MIIGKNEFSFKKKGARRYRKSWGKGIGGGYLRHLERFGGSGAGEEINRLPNHGGLLLMLAGGHWDAAAFVVYVGLHSR